MKNIEINENIPHCLIQDYLLYNLNLFEAKKQRKKKAHNGNPLKFIERRAYFLYFYFDQSSRKKKEQQQQAGASETKHFRTSRHERCTRKKRKIC
jgi:hypothetical protein